MVKTTTAKGSTAKKATTTPATKTAATPAPITMPNMVYQWAKDGLFFAQLMGFANKHAGGNLNNLIITPNSNINLNNPTQLYPATYKTTQPNYTKNNGYMLAMFATGCPLVQCNVANALLPYHLNHSAYAKLGKINLLQWHANGNPTSNNLMHIVHGQRVGGHTCHAWRVIGQALNGTTGAAGAGKYPCITVSVAPTVK